MTTIKEQLDNLDLEIKALTEQQKKIQRVLDDMATSMGISEIKIYYTHDFESKERKVKVIKDMNGKNLITSVELDYGDLESTYGDEITQIEELEPANSVKFINEGEIENKYKLISDEQVKELDLYYGELIIHFFRLGISHEEAGKFLNMLFQEEEILPYLWWDDYN